MDYTRALHSLAVGSPYYRHTDERTVPWPYLENPLRNADKSTIDKWTAMGGNHEEIQEEVDRLRGLEIPEDEISTPLISNNVHRPNRVVYTSHLPYHEEIPVEHLGRGIYRWRFVTEKALMKCIMREFRIVIPGTSIVRSVSLRIANRGVTKTIQVFEYPETRIISFLQRYLGMTLVCDHRDVKYLTIPFFFSREPGYGLPIFIFDAVEVLFELDNDGVSRTFPRVVTSMDALHSKPEIDEIVRSRSHRVEDLVESKTSADRWIYANCFWRRLSDEFIGRGVVRLVHDGSLDEEIKGVFWKISNPDAMVRLEYHLDGDIVIPLMNFHPCAILAEIELRQKILPSTSGTFLTNPESRGGHGGLLLTRYVDSLDCEAGLSPRCGDLILRFDKDEMDIEIYILCSRDFHC